MPTKRNRAGKQQNYIEAGHGDASGEYGDNATGSNIHFQNFKKPTDSVGVEIKTKEHSPEYKEMLDGVKRLKDGRDDFYSLMSKLEAFYDDGTLTYEEVEEIGEMLEKANEEAKAKPKEPEKDYNNYYKGTGKEHLKNSLSERLSSVKGKITPNGKKLLDQIDEADDELSGVIGDYYVNNPKTYIKLGANLNSKFTTYSMMGQIIEQGISIGGSGIGGEKADNYSKGGVFFHESGHALNHSYSKGIYSENFQSKKYGKTLSDMIYEEIQSNVKYEDLKKDFDDMVNSYKTAEYDDMLTQKKSLDDQLAEYGKKAQETPQVMEVQKRLDEARQKKVDSFKLGKYEEMRKYQEEEYKLRDEWGMAYKNSFPVNYQSLVDKKNKLNDELSDRKIKAYSEANIKYGDISDMCQASLGKKLAMGHGYGYFNDVENRGDEAFAEIMSAKATNPNSLEVLKKYIPKSLEIFDEIILSIKKGE